MAPRCERVRQLGGRARALFVAALAAAAIPLGAAGDRPTVVATVAPLASVVERLAGDSVEVRIFVPPGADVETFEPTPRQVAALATAALVFRVGRPSVALEARFLESAIAARPDVPQVSFARLEPRSVVGGSPERSVLAGDPHVWLSLRAMRPAIAELVPALSGLLPEAAGEIAERAKALDREIAALDAALVARFADDRGRAFYVFHPALGWFAADFGLVQVAIERDGKEPSPARLAALVAEARAAGVRTVLSQRGLPSRGAELLARELGGRTIEIDPMGKEWLANLAEIGRAVEAALAR